MSARRTVVVGLALVAACAAGVWVERLLTLRLVLNHFRNTTHLRGRAWKR